MRSTTGPRRRRLARALALMCAMLAVALGVGVPAANANVPGGPLYQPASSNEGLGYVRTIRLAHSTVAGENGKLLTTFEHWTANGTQSDYVIEQSSNGTDWTQVNTVAGDVNSFQPFLFEFPQQLGSYPAGTLMLVGATQPYNNGPVSFREWRSPDDGATWQSVGIVQSAPAQANPQFGNGIWEPFIGMDNNNDLVMYFSDERDNGTYSQFLGHMISTDGGDTWSANPDGSTRFAPGEVKDVASNNKLDRPGMMTVTRIGTTGQYVASYELCGPNYNCFVHYKTSPDGDNWGSGPADLGTLAQTGDGRTLQGSPVITWSPAGGPNGELVLTGRHEFRNGVAGPEDAAAVFLNTSSGSGSWSWMPAPIAVPMAGPTGTSTCATNYSPELLVGTDGRTVSYSAAGATGPFGCEELTGSSNAGVLPDTAEFTNGDAGWARYGGTFSTTGDVYRETAGGSGGNKAVTGSTGWTNYNLAGDVRLDTVGANGNAGFLVRATDPTQGTDSVDGYLIGVSQSQLFIGKEGYGWTQLASTAIPGGLAAGAWYHLTVGVTGCAITVQGEPSGSTANPAYLAVNDCSFLNGSVGVRDFNTTASWQNINVTTAGAIVGPAAAGFCVDDNTNTNTDGNAVQLYSCNGVPGQMWSALADGTIRAFGKCMTVSGNATADFTKIILDDCDGSGGQQWTPRADGSLYNPQSGRCLDDPGGVRQNLTQLQIYDCTGGWPQQWAMP